MYSSKASELGTSLSIKNQQFRQLVEHSHVLEVGTSNGDQVSGGEFELLPSTWMYCTMTLMFHQNMMVGEREKTQA